MSRAAWAPLLSVAAALASTPPASAATTAPFAGREPGGIRDAELTRRTASDPAALVAGLGRGRAEWLAWSVPAVTDARDVCCFGRNFRERSCRLSSEGNGWGTTSDFRGSGPSSLTVLLEVSRGEPSRLIVAGATCPVDGDGRTVTELDGVDPAKSLDLLERVAREERGDLGERALSALGYHAGDDAGLRLERLATDPKNGLELRKNALFWAGQTRPGLGVALADRILSGENGAELREQALFVLSQTETPEATSRLRRAAESDRQSETRSKALFWLSQIDAPDAPAWIYAAVDQERDREVREQGVFALSQVDGGATWLMRLLRESEHADVRRQALFWLGQSDDPRALDELERLLER